MRSSELAKTEIINTWNNIAQKLMVDMMDNTVPPFTIAAGTRITVYSPEDLIVACLDKTKKCYMDGIGNKEQKRFKYNEVKNIEVDKTGPDWFGQVRSFQSIQYCKQDNGKWIVDPDCTKDASKCGNYDYRTLKLWCESMNYKSKTEIQQDAYHASEVKKYQDTYGTVDAEGNVERTEEQQAAYDEMVGITYDEEGYVENPFAAPESAPAEATLTCSDGTPPDANGCCTGEVYTDMGEMGFNCCPEAGGDCFPPLM
jgi:hypothetical protein